jgi:TetR/AcrR family transcriptional regulator
MPTPPPVTRSNAGSRAQKPVRQRARADEEKAARRQQILDAALHLFASTEYSSLTMSGVAREAGLAKGTVYLYFSGKEALFFQLVGDQLQAWFTSLASQLLAVSDPDSLGTLVASELARRPTLLRLVSIVHTVLEHNVNVSEVLAFKRTMLASMTGAAAVFESRFPHLRGAGLGLIRRVYALIVGLCQTSTVSPTVREAIEADPELSVLQADFRTELAVSIAALVRGTAVIPMEEGNANKEEAGNDEDCTEEDR